MFHLAGSYARPGTRSSSATSTRRHRSARASSGRLTSSRSPRRRTVAALFDDALDPAADDLIHETPFRNLWIVPATNDLTDHNTPRPEEAESQDTLRDFLAEVRSHFDVVLIDCPPNLQLCSWAALLASDFVVVPVIPEDFSSQGLIYVQQAIDAAMTRKNPRLRLLGYMLTMYNRQLGIHKAYEKLLREQYGDLVLETVFPLATAFKEAVSQTPSHRRRQAEVGRGDAVKALAGDPRTGPRSSGPAGRVLLRREPLRAGRRRNLRTRFVARPRARRPPDHGKDRRTPQGNGLETSPSRSASAPAPCVPSRCRQGRTRQASPKDGFTRNRAAGEMLLENIVPDPTQPRKEFDPAAIERLTESIKARGLLQPLRVRWNPELGKHVILVGERRYRAAQLAGLTSVPCIFVETELTEAEILEEQLVENLLREDLNAIEQAHSFKRYMELVGCHAKDLAQLLKVAPSTVTRALSLLKLPEAVQEQIADGEIPAKTGFEIAKLKDDTARKAMAEKVVTEKLTADDAAKVVRQKKGKAAPKSRGTNETFRLEGGIKVVLSAPKKLGPTRWFKPSLETVEQLRRQAAA